VDTAVSQGMAVGDEQLALLIHNLDAFQVDGKFSREQYEGFLRAQGYVPEGFEETFRRSLLTGQVEAGVSAAAFLTRPEVDRLLRLQGQTRTFRYLRVPASRFLSEVQVTDAAVADYYREHQQEFQSPEQVQVDYVEVSRQALAADVAIQEDELRQWYDTHRESYTLPEQRRARHILLPLTPEATPEQVEVTLGQARELLTRLRAGESFEDLARAHSRDPGSVQQGGDLGFFGRGAMEAPFEEAVFAMSVGDLSEPVRTRFGVHILRLDAVQKGGPRPFQEARADVLREVQIERSEPLFFEQAERLANLAYEHPDTLEPAAKALGLTIRTSELFGRSGGPGIAADPKVISAAFRDEVIQEGRNSDPVELRGNRVVVLRVKEHRPATQRALDEVRGDVVERLRSEAAGVRAAALAQDLVTTLREGGDPADLLRQHDLQWTELLAVTRGSTAAAPQVVATAFRLPRPTAGGESYGETLLGDGDAAVIALKEVKDGSTEGNRAEDLGRAVAQIYGRGFYEAVVDSLRRRTEVQVYGDRL